MVAPTPANMQECTPKCRCITGPYAGQAYDCGNPCKGQGGDCSFDCIDGCACSAPSRYWILEWLFSPNTTPNCIGRPNLGYCQLGPLEGPYYTQVTFPVGIKAVYSGPAGSWYRADELCGGGYGPGGLGDGGYCERTGATHVDKGPGWQTCDNATWPTGYVSRMEFFGFEITENLSAWPTSPGDLWIKQLGPNSSGAVNCHVTQYILSSAYPTDSSFDPL